MYTYEYQNESDWDMAVSGILLFSDPASAPRLVTVDKAGYGYVFTQGNLCGPGMSGCSLENGASSVQGFAAGDNGNVFPFGAVSSPGTEFCTSSFTPDTCKRITSLAFYHNTDNSKYYLTLWPYKEPLTAFQMAEPSVQQTGPGTITVSSTAVTGTGTAFLSHVIAGHTLIPGNPPVCTFGTTCPIVTSVTDDTHLTISSSLSISTPAPWNYAGFFINPSRSTPPPTQSNVGYAGGALTVASNAGSGGVIWAVVAAPGPNTGVRELGALYAYDAKPTSSYTLTNLYTGPSTDFCASPFARPTVANGLVFVATWALGSTCPPTSGSISGLVVYGL